MLAESQEKIHEFEDTTRETSAEFCSETAEIAVEATETGELGENTQNDEADNGEAGTAVSRIMFSMATSPDDKVVATTPDAPTELQLHDSAEQWAEAIFDIYNTDGY
ncbi:hypothetical protein G7Z17_g7732 [Cylindrodendrum hubeiense]|uniref:Uncharacterized protein n=1 Tax=Cylindrodendrum hubeiense TaxID=595255 RepID=A0A9P5H7R8_9HYPO|nr:hypothetical protein G7Z17_g7732 [Cylindrodendrum hubeiense]